MHLFHLTYSKQSKYGWKRFKTANKKLPIARRNLAFYRIKYMLHRPLNQVCNMHIKNHYTRSFKSR